MKFWLKFGMIIFSAAILYVSFARAGLDRINGGENYDNLRNVPIYFQAKNNLGVSENYCYKFPETRTLPDSPLYFIKNLRDEFWVHFSKNPLEKASILLLIADKKAEESIRLDEKGRDYLAEKTIKNAILKLEKSKKIVKSLNQNDIEVMKMSEKIDKAVMVYKHLIDFLKLDNNIKNLLINNVEKCYE